MSDSVESPGSSSGTNVLDVKTPSPQNNGGESSAPQPPTGGGSQDSQPPTGAGPPSVQNSAAAVANNGDNSPPSPPQSPESSESPPPATQPPPASPPPSSSPPPSPPTSPPPSPNPPKTSESPPSPTSSEPPPSSPPPSSPPPESSQQSSPTSPSKSDPPPAPENPSTPTPASGSNGSVVTPPLQPSPLSPVEFTPPSPDRSSNASPVPPRSITPPSRNDGGRDAGGSSTSQSYPPAPEGKSSKTPTPSNGKGEHGNGNGSVASKAIVGAILGGALLIMILAIVLFARSRKKRKGTYPPQYMPPGNFPVKQDGFYYGQQPQSMGFSGPSNPSYGSQPPYSFGDSYASSGGNGYSGAPDSSVISGGKIHFSYEDLMEMTNGFSHQNIIGEGGFGCVYKGCMSDGKVVAVKQLKAGSGQGEREFRAEVEIISRVHHRYLVSLVGYCISNSQRLLIYEFVPNNTLEHHLHAKDLPVLDWPKRLKIAIGSAKGLAYLHEDCHPKIIHRDIKSANILLDDDFEAQVADFGLARLNDTAQTHVSTRVMGTFGYLAPEYASSGKLTDRSDVYSFGVVLLELITGRKPIDQSQPLGDESLVEWARPLLLQALETGDLSLVVDPRLGKHYVEGEMIRMIETAAACVRHSGPKRPRMAQVVRALDSDDMGDLTNGTKYGQSVAYNSGQYNEEIMKFRRMALADSADLTGYRGEYNSPEMSRGYASSESETRAINLPNRQYV